VRGGARACGGTFTGGRLDTAFWVFRRRHLCRRVYRVIRPFGSTRRASAAAALSLSEVRCRCGRARIVAFQGLGAYAGGQDCARGYLVERISRGQLYTRMPYPWPASARKLRSCSRLPCWSCVSAVAREVESFAAPQLRPRRPLPTAPDVADPWLGGVRKRPSE